MSVPGGGKLTLTIKSFATLMVHNVTKVNIWEKKKNQLYYESVLYSRSTLMLIQTKCHSRHDNSTVKGTLTGIQT